MPRRRQFPDVADGISGHFLKDWPWATREWWPLRDIGRAYLAGLGGEYRFDIVAGTVSPENKDLTSIARRLRIDLDRHLQVRGLPREWLQAATLTLRVAPSPEGEHGLRIMCRVVITDDRGTEHPSTRRSSTWLPAPGVFRRLIDRIRLRTD